MSTWVSIGIAAAALVYTVVANWIERSQRRREFDLMRSQAAAAEEDRLDRRRAYVSVEARGKRGGETFDSHDFEVHNAGPGLVRHLAIRIDRADGSGLVGPMKVDPHLLQVGEIGRATAEVPRAERLSDLVVVVEWVDPEQNEDWMHNQTRKERVVAALEPVSRNP